LSDLLSGAILDAVSVIECRDISAHSGCGGVARGVDSACLKRKADRMVGAVVARGGAMLNDGAIFKTGSLHEQE
jgi:hypothetical protein